MHDPEKASHTQAEVAVDTWCLSYFLFSSMFCIFFIRTLRWIKLEQKKTKYGPTADQYNLQFVSAVFSQTGQIHAPFKSFFTEQIRQKLITFEGQAKPSKIKSLMKWWSKCISMAIAKTASRNVAFKFDKLVEALFEDQSAVQTRQVATDGISIEDTDFEDLGRNADLYIFNQDDRQD